MLSSFTDQFESAMAGSRTVGRIAASLNELVRKVMLGGPARDLLAGRQIGHPAHPGLVAGPMGLWLSALACDLSGEREAARRLTGLGVWAAAPAVASGLSDWADTDGTEQRLGAVHLAVNGLAVILFGISWRLRRGGHCQTGQVVGWAGGAALGLGGWLGGHLAYALGVGVDTNAFEGGPAEWSSVEDLSAGRDDVRLGSARVDGVGLVVIRADDQTVRVLAERCSHRGGPLSAGQVAGGCIRCPWHGSEFDIESGAARKGPATAPQPAYQVRAGSHGLEVRRKEGRALRNNSVRPSR
jgi:nitrite reductase/ring-hydroxylating ferredoxin subunit/uncharacterized membrane protein